MYWNSPICSSHRQRVFWKKAKHYILVSEQASCSRWNECGQENTWLKIQHKRVRVSFCQSMQSLLVFEYINLIGRGLLLWEKNPGILTIFLPVWLHVSLHSLWHWCGLTRRTTFWPLWWRISLSIRVQTTLNHFRFVKSQQTSPVVNFITTNGF